MRFLTNKHWFPIKKSHIYVDLFLKTSPESGIYNIYKTDIYGWHEVWQQLVTTSEIWIHSTWRSKKRSLKSLGQPVSPFTITIIENRHFFLFSCYFLANVITDQRIVVYQSYRKNLFKLCATTEKLHVTSFYFLLICWF